MEYSGKRDWLVKLRKESGMTVNELSRKAGITPQFLNYLETGQRDPGLRVGLALADVLGFDPHRFIEDAEDDEAS